jgi:tRNA threonylcarbamoyladenosine biosynthesis protein TsaB
MPLILHIVAVSKDNELLSLKETNAGNSHSSVITNFISEAIAERSLNLSDIDAVAVSKGPGSYTGLRIGVSAAKGLCYSLDKPLISVNTLQAMAWGMNELKQKNSAIPETTLFCPMIDARRMEVYVAFYDKDFHEIRETSADIIDEYSYAELLAKHPVIFGGSGSAKCREILSAHPNACFLDHFQLSARYMISFAENSFKRSEFENTAYFEPFYLKDFVAGKPRVKGL